MSIIKTLLGPYPIPNTFPDIHNGISWNCFGIQFSVKILSHISTIFHHCYIATKLLEAHLEFGIKLAGQKTFKLLTVCLLFLTEHRTQSLLNPLCTFDLWYKFMFIVHRLLLISVFEHCNVAMLQCCGCNEIQ